MKNHAANIGGYAVDGCREFSAAARGQERLEAELTCAACGCHRNFHRVEWDFTNLEASAGEECVGNVRSGEISLGRWNSSRKGGRQVDSQSQGGAREIEELVLVELFFHLKDKSDVHSHSGVFKHTGLARRARALLCIGSDPPRTVLFSDWLGSKVIAGEGAALNGLSPSSSKARRSLPPPPPPVPRLRARLMLLVAETVSGWMESSPTQKNTRRAAL
ncbi:hypothetical protein SASPL_128336 [Salvia splendens]|uniref:ZF-HD dimerization-type domain-containing protein n=1 Tax=Salvia splendens TaxID=180675 RepID=A0A8X8ZLZ9_SALSN|nr:hypothetical protein SASPL_128336 [Salvia splendens]